MLLFCTALLVCVVFDFSILYALIIGLLIFLLCGLKQGFSLREILQMCLSGIKTARNILITFLLIGILTAVWRAAGTIPLIICYAASLIRPSLFLLMSFLLNCAVSILTGTAFGTAATMGVICATMAAAMDVPPILVGGVVLSGVYFGDRCSPVSTSALLVSELTHTNIFDNIRIMAKNAGGPFLISCALYFFIGAFTPMKESNLDLRALFGQEFQLHWIALLPATLILVFSCCKVEVKFTLLLSILSAVPICLFLQNISLLKLASFSVFGFHVQNAKVAEMLDGGGVISMLKVAAIICISSAYSGIFQKIGLLDHMKQSIVQLGKTTTSFNAMLLTSILTGIVACNQTLTIMLTHQLCRDTEPDSQKLASNLEDTAVVVAPLIPWSIAGEVPLASAAAPSLSIAFAFFLYLLPIWRLIKSKPSGGKGTYRKTPFPR